MFAAKYAANGLLRTSKSLVAQPLRSHGLRSMTVLSKESAQEYEKKVRKKKDQKRTLPAPSYLGRHAALF